MDKDLRKKRAIEEIQSLPTLPIIMLKILECVDDPRSSAEDMKGIIIKDSAISSKILGLANSAYYGYAQEINDITRAIVILGIEIITDVAVSVSLTSMLMPSTSSLNVSMDDLWKHSIAAGEACRLCANEGIYNHKEQAYLIGIMHDIGKNILANYFTDGFNESVKNAQDNGDYLYNTEEEILGFTHNEAGAWLSEKWKLPKTMSIAMEFHHHPEEAPEEFQKEAVLAYFADYLVKLTDIGNSGDNNKLPFEVSPLVESVLGINKEKIKELSEKLEEVRPKIDAFMASIF